MTAVLLGQYAPGSPEWHDLRARGLGGSETGAVLGLSPFESRFSLWHRKAGMIAPVEETPAMEWGKRLEAPILGKYMDMHPTVERLPGGTFHAAGRPWQIANPDFLAVDRVVDAKFSLFGDDYGPHGSDEIPPHVRTQGVWYMDTLEVERCDIAVLIGGHDYRELTFHYDAREARMIREAGERFLDDLERNIRPEIDGHSETYSTVRELHPEIVDDSVELSNTVARLFIEARRAHAAAEEQWNLARSTVSDAMADAKTATWDGQKIAGRQVRGDGRPFVVAARRLPEIEDQGEAA